MVSRPESFLPLKSDVVVILLALANRPLHGYAIIQEAERRSSGSILLQTGALYRTLKHLLADHLIEECAAPKDAESADERRRYYRTTALGARVLAAEVERMAALVRAARAVDAGKRPRFA